MVSSRSKVPSPPLTPPVSRSRLPPKPGFSKRIRNITATSSVSDSHAPLPMPRSTIFPPLTSPTTPTPPQPPRRSWSRRSASWTPEEDARLVELVNRETAHPPSITASKTWSRVAAQLTNRTGKQCRERYLNQLKPGIRREPWSAEEERILHENHARFGNKWVTIASFLPGRTDNCVKNHWNSMLRKHQRRQAALKVAQSRIQKVAQSRATTVQPPPLPHPTAHIVETDHHTPPYTGCVTPSGMSSGDFIRGSGSPSPFAASPITPRRDAKLQISSLVAATAPKLPDWDSPINGTHDLPLHRDVILPSVGMTTTAMVLRKSECDVSPLVGATNGESRLPSAILTDPQLTPVQVSHGIPASAVAAVAAHTDVRDDVSDKVDMYTPRVLRRSSRLSALDIGKQTKGRERGKKAAMSTNALAALAAAASSIPPSPVTPESRYTVINRSASMSSFREVRHVLLPALNEDHENRRPIIRPFTRSSARRMDMGNGGSDGRGTF